MMGPYQSWVMVMVELNKLAARGAIVAFEGGDGAGKGSQARLLHEAFKQRGLESLITREPGGTPMAERLRDILVRGEPGDLDPMSELLILAAARVEHIRTLLRPAVANGRLVIMDRSQGSMFAYQGYGRGIPLERIQAIHDFTTDQFKPDLTIFLAFDAVQGWKRSMKRLDKQGSSENRFEKEALDFHKRVAHGYTELAGRDPSWVTVDGRGTPEEVHARVMRVVEERISYLFKPMSRSEPAPALTMGM